MERQHLSQTKNAIAPPQNQIHASDRNYTHPVEELQGAIGNRAVNKLLANQPTLQTKPMFGGLSRELVIQPKLTIGAVGDKYEQEADRVASQVVQQIHTPPTAESTPNQSVQGGRENGAIRSRERVKQTEQKIERVQLTTTGIDIQLYKDLKELYKYDTQDKGAQLWLNDYIKIQELLADKTRVKKHLKALSQSMMMEGGLDEALSASEKGTWTDAKPLLTGFVPASEFEKIVEKGQIFVDLVAQKHGRQTHRIQWFCIQQEANKNSTWLTHTAIQLYQNAVNKDWKKNNLNMWDAIVDGSGTEIYDFTKPENLEAYLSEDWLPFWYSRQKSLRPILKEVRKEHKNQPVDKEREQNNWKTNAPPEEQKKLHQPDDRVEVGSYIYTGFFDNQPTIMYKSDENPDQKVL